MIWEQKLKIVDMLKESGGMTTDQSVTTFYPNPKSEQDAKQAHTRIYRTLVWLRKWNLIKSEGKRGRGNNLTWRAV